MIALLRKAGLLVVLVVAATLAFASSASAAEYALEVGESLASTGEGEVICEWKEEGFVEEEFECEYLVLEGKKVVKLIPVPEEPESEFVRFENGTGSAAKCNEKTSACSFTLEEDSYIEARFDEIVPKLAVKATGEGEVLCTEEGLPPEFADECEEEFEFGAEVTLVPSPEPGWEFAGFKGGTGSAKSCNGKTKLCTFFIEEDSAIEGSFVPITHLLTIAKAGTGSGAVTSSPAGINCGSACAAKFAEGAVTLTASPAAGSTFAGWSGGGCSGTGFCVVTIGEADVAVTATFSAKPPPPPGKARAAAVAKVGSGKARVRLTCSGGPCKGVLKLKAKLRRRGRLVVVGRSPFALADGASEVVKVKLSPALRKQLRKRHVLRVRAVGSGLTAGTVKLKLGR
ncbi:MAG: InlB B-repeat-containing protein [Chloroflexota bacterium]